MRGIRFTAEVMRELDGAFADFVSAGEDVKRTFPTFSSYFKHRFKNSTFDGVITEVNAAKYEYALVHGDIERAAAYSIYNGNVSLIADMEIVCDCGLFYKINTMHIDIPKHLYVRDGLFASNECRSYCSGGICSDTFFEDEICSVFTSMYGGLLTRFYLANEDTTINDLSKQKDGIAYVYYLEE